MTLSLKDVRCAWSSALLEDQSTGGDGGWRESIEGVNLELGAGMWCGIVGDNGLGKSTLLHGVAGSCPHVHGTIRINGQVLSERDIYQRFELGLYFVPQEPKCEARWSFEDIQEMAFCARPGLRMKNAVPTLWRDVSAISGITSRRHRRFSPRQARLVLGMISCPSVLLLDEVGNHFRPAPATAVYDLIRKQLPDAAVLFVEHDIRITKSLSNTVIFASVDSNDRQNLYRFQLVEPMKLEELPRRSAVQDLVATPLPYLDYAKGAVEHLELAHRASVVTDSAVTQLRIREARRLWPFLSRHKPVGQLSGGQKVILQCVMELVADGVCNLDHDRTSHVFQNNVVHLRRLNDVSSLDVG